MQHMLKKRRKWFFVHSDFGASCVNLWYYTEKRCWTFIFLPLGENHISDKSIILPACHMVIWNSASTTWTYTINQKLVRKKKVSYSNVGFQGFGGSCGSTSWVKENDECCVPVFAGGHNNDETHQSLLPLHQQVQNIQGQQKYYTLRAHLSSLTCL